MKKVVYSRLARLPLVPEYFRYKPNENRLISSFYFIHNGYGYSNNLKKNFMLKLIIYLLLTMPVFCAGQGLGIGLKAGYNFANVTSAASINNSSRSGFMAGIFLAPQTKGIITSRHEFIYSRQGYNFDNGTTTGNVNLDYIIIPQMLGINITKFVQLQLGMQMAFLLNAKADSTSKSGWQYGQLYFCDGVL